MKSKYSILFCLVLLLSWSKIYGQVDPPCLILGATLCDNMDAYVADDPLGPGASWWTTWSGAEGGAEDGTVTDEYAYSGANSALIPEGGTTDVILKLGNQSAGKWRLQWQMFVPDAKEAYYNIQESETPGVAWNMEVYFGQTVSGTGEFTVPVGPSFTYPIGAWFLVEHIIDLDANTIQVYIDGILTLDDAYGGSIGAIDFYSVSVDNRYFLDDVLFEEILPAEPCDIPDAVFCDNIDTYTAGDAVGPYADWWSTWSGVEGGAEDGLVSDDQAYSNENSVLIPEGGSTDVILKLGDLSSGKYRLEWQMYVPSAKEAYYNIQETEVPGVAWNLELYFGQTVEGEGVFTVPAGGPTFTYPVDAWFRVEHIVDLDANTIEVLINGVLALSDVYEGNLGGVDFYSISADNRCYLDDILLIEELAAAPCAIPGADLCDNIDTYNAGDPLGPFADWWTTWSGTEGGAEDGTVSDDHAFSGTNSVLIPEGGTTDVILKLGNLNSGNYKLEWQMYVPADAHAYYNIQETEVPGVAWNLELSFGTETGGEGVFTVPADGPTFSYPEDGWFLVQHYIDLDANLIVVFINGVPVHGGAYAGQLGGIDFYSIDGLNRYYLDDILLIENEIALNMYYEDADGDDFGNADVYIVALGAAPAGYVADNTDCDDTNENIYPGATEVDNNLDDDCDELIDEDIVGISDPLAQIVVEIYPVPSDGHFNLHLTSALSSDAVEVKMYNSYGELVYGESFLSGAEITKAISVEDLASGVYLMYFISGENVLSRQMVIQR